MAIGNRKLRMIMVGGGPGAGIARVHRAAALMDNEYELVAGAFSSNPEKSKMQGMELYIDPDRAYGSWEEMLEKENALPAEKRPDVVCIVTPNHMHYAPAKRALELGFHVVMDKPITVNLEQALDLRECVKKSGKALALTHAYAACSTVKLARDLVKQGKLGTVTKIVVEYPQGWLNRLAEREDKAATWRTDPATAGSGCVGDIGTHAANLSETITGMRITSVAADVGTVVNGRKADDDFTALARWNNSVRGSVQASQISSGEGNGLNIRVYGTEAGLFWTHREMESLTIIAQDRPLEKWGRNTAYANAASPAAARAARCYADHPEGYLEEFANVYYNLARTIRSLDAGETPSDLDLDFPNVEDGIRGLAFVEACLASSRNNSAWTEVKEY